MTNFEKLVKHELSEFGEPELFEDFLYAFDNAVDLDLGSELRDMDRIRKSIIAEIKHYATHLREQKRRRL